MDKSNREILPLLEALKPHMGDKGQGFLEAVLDMVKLLNSNSVQDIIKRFYKISPVLDRGNRVVTVNTQLGKMEFSSGTFIIILAVVLLLFLNNSQ